MDRWNRVQQATTAPRPAPPRFDDRIYVRVEDHLQLLQICRRDGRCYRPPSAAWCEAADGRREGPYVTWDEYWRPERHQYRNDHRVVEQDP